MTNNEKTYIDTLISRVLAESKGSGDMGVVGLMNEDGVGNVFATLKRC